MRLDSLFLKICIENYGKTAAIENDNEIKYGELLEMASKVSRYFTTQNITKGQHIGLIFNNQIEFICSMFGILLSGNIVVPISYNATCEEIDGIIRSCDVSACITDKKKSNLIKGIPCFDYDEAIRCECVGNNRQMKEMGDEKEVAFIFSTSGSTGVSKSVQLTHENIYESARAHSESLQLSEDDIFLVTMPFHMSHGVSNVIVSCIMSLTKIAIYKVPIIPRKMASILNKHKITIFSSVPTYMSLFSKYQSKRCEFPSVKTVIISGAKLYEKQYLEIKNIFKNADVIHTYGLTEASPRVTMMTKESDYLSSGKPVRGVEVRIVNSAGEILPTEEVGEICVKGKNVMKGYYKNDDLTRNTIVDGWLYTGDLGMFDAAGNLHIMSRKKNIIISGGQNIYPEEIEEKLLAYDNVREVVAFGYPDELYGEIVLVIMAVNSEEDFYRHDKELFEKKISSYKKPLQYIIVDNLPKTATDKIDRKKSKALGTELYSKNCLICRE